MNLKSITLTKNNFLKLKSNNPIKKIKCLPLKEQALKTLIPEK